MLPIITLIEQLMSLQLSAMLPATVLPHYVFLHYAVVMTFLLCVISSARASAKSTLRRSDDSIAATCENENGDNGDDETGSCLNVPPITITSKTTTILSDSLAEVANLVAATVDDTTEDDNCVDGRTIVQTFVIRFPSAKKSSKTVQSRQLIEKLPVIVAVANGEKAPRKYFELLTTVKTQDAPAKECKYIEVLTASEEQKCTPANTRKFFEVISAAPKESPAEAQAYYEVLPAMRGDKEAHIETRLYSEELPAGYKEKDSSNKEASANIRAFYEELPTAYTKNIPTEEAQYYEMLPTINGEKEAPAHFEYVKAGDYSTPNTVLNNTATTFEEIQQAIKAHKIDPSVRIPLMTGLANQYFKNNTFDHDDGLVTPSTANTVVVDPYEPMWSSEPVYIIDCAEEDKEDEQDEENLVNSHASTTTPSCSASVSDASTEDSDEDDDDNGEALDWCKMYPQSNIIPLLSKKPFNNFRPASSLFASHCNTLESSQHSDSNDNSPSSP